MATVNERSLGVARLYGRAILTVAQEQGEAASLGAELDELLELAARDAELERFLASPVLERESRQRSLEKMLRGRASDLLVDSLQVINGKGRLDILSQIVAVYHDEYRKDLGQIEVDLRTAHELTERQRAELKERIGRTTGKEAHLVEVVDPELLGGLVVQIGDQKIDMSVRRDLELLSGRFAARLSAELLAGKEFATGGELAGNGAPESQDGRDEDE